ncbi:glycosyltransferase family 9 protein [Candidatus Protochlamydia amoebophila]|uniref:Putative heptosyltransferase I n=1 Tax=Candidatus Protochlamydia amoebophila TaxID=362787 RepID=A0A0C1H576_9BACT|nr:glycosyltransferase family 9 protein [Candidatus Protochlamydia amoebophila]KIC72609.1 putative heptosyltransferase I [Candidatus Protochlamydia amoebophila]
MKILIVKTSSLGDIIHAFPALQLLRRLYPDAQIDWVVEKSFVELIESHPDLSQAISIPLKEWRKQFWTKRTWQAMAQWIKEFRQVSYQLVFDLQGNSKSGLITKLAKGKRKIGFGRQTVSEWPNLLATKERYNPPMGANIREDYLFLVQKTLDKQESHQAGVKLNVSFEQEQKIAQILHSPYLKKSLKVMVCPGSNWPNKQLTLDTFEKFLSYLSNQYDACFVFIWGTLQEKKIVGELTAKFPETSLIVERLALPLLQTLMFKIDLVISVDSLALHLAGTTSTPTYSIFGPSSARKYKPLGLLHEAFQGLCPYGNVFEKRCPILRTCSTGNCIKNIPINTLVEHFSRWWLNNEFVKSNVYHN